MARSNIIVDREMRKQGFVSAPIVCTQYGISRATLLDAILQGKIAPQKPDPGNAVFYAKWADCLAFFGTPLEYRTRLGTQNAIPEDEPEVLLDGMIPIGEIEDFYRAEAEKKAVRKKAVQSNAAVGEVRKVTVRPADFGKVE